MDSTLIIILSFTFLFVLLICNTIRDIEKMKIDGFKNFMENDIELSDDEKEIITEALKPVVERIEKEEKKERRN